MSLGLLGALAPCVDAAEAGRGVVLEAHATPPTPSSAREAGDSGPTLLTPATPDGDDDAVDAVDAGTRAPTGAGPTVELITGGRSSDGAARVGRLPVLD
ncbi:MAG: hypothetical protein RLW61_14820 [Gammaproteobacteria bacterium]